MKQLIWLALFVWINTGSLAQSIIPKPQQISASGKSFTFSGVEIIAAPALKNEADLLTQYFAQHKIPTGHQYVQKIILATEKSSSYINDEAYVLQIEKDSITLKAPSAKGIFYGLQSLLQIIGTQRGKFVAPHAEILDWPVFPWRGMHLDVSRHFFPISFIKQYIDVLAMHKMNTFHWHLTDDQGWRIEIKKYPLLTTIGSKRSESMLAKNFAPYVGDGKPVEGFYSQEEIKEVVQYAATKHITVVPEIEMPGHSVAAIAAYPFLGCTGKRGEVLKVWGVSEDVLCVKDSTFRFVYDVLEEVLALFPSKYIHIGGDEVPKTNWKKCAQCQSVIRQEGLKDEHELQSFFITKIDSFLTAKGRNTLGWDEILEGGLAPHAAVMSWRGEEGGIQAAALKHNVVMCPGSHCYFDHYQGNKNTEPLAIGGFTTIRKTYSYHPVPASLDSASSRYVLGAQGNVWMEYISTPQHVLYMALPRLCALSEVVWTKKELRHYDDFVPRLVTHFSWLDDQKINYSKAIFDVNATPNIKTGKLIVTLTADLNGYDIRYTTDGSTPSANANQYTTPIAIEKSTTLKAALFKGDRRVGNVLAQPFYINKATAATVALATPPAPQYNTGGAATLVDGVVGELPWTGKEWLGWRGENMSATIDLSKPQNINLVRLSFLQESPSWIHLPQAIIISTSLDGKAFQQDGLISLATIKKQWKEEKFIHFPLKKLTRYVKIEATCLDNIPEGHNGAGEKAWLFCSEIIVE